MRWNHQTILDEIRQLHAAGEELNFTLAEKNHPHAVRAALWHYGGWKRAVELAGFDYESVSKYRRWTRERLVEAIRDHHQAGRDLSWRAVSTRVDPSLAAAALRPNTGFSSWREAISAAGLDPAKIARYRHWTRECIVAQISELSHQGSDLSSKAVKEKHKTLHSAAVRHFKSWSGALRAAGIDPQLVACRSPYRDNFSRPDLHQPHRAENPLPPLPNSEAHRLTQFSSSNTLSRGKDRSSAR